MSTIQHIDTPRAQTAAVAPSRVIGIHVALPPLAFWTAIGPETEMLSRLISVALNRRSLLVGKLDLIAFDHQVIGFASVTSLGIALSTISGELSAVQLITGAHLAWNDQAEGIWRSERPLPEPMPFQRRIDAFTAWIAARKAQTAESWNAQMGQILGELGATIAKMTKQQPPAQDAKP